MIHILRHRDRLLRKHKQLPINGRVHQAFNHSLNNPKVSRNFTTFDPVLQTHMTMQTPKTFAGDFEFYFDAAVSSEDSYFGVLSKTPSVSDDFFRFISTTGGNGIQTFLGGEYLNITGLNYKDGKIRRFGYRRTAKLLELIVNGVVVVARTQSGAVLPVSIGFIGRAGYFNGVIANVTLTDLTTPSNSESWELDRPIGTNTEQSSSGNNLLTYVNATKREEFTKVGNDWLGAELWTFGTITFEGSEANFSVRPSGGDSVLATDTRVRYTSNYNIASGAARFRIGDLLLNSVSGVGVVSGTTPAGVDRRMPWQATAVPVIGTMTNTSVKRILEIT